MDECSICYENMESSGIITLNCGHTFHKACISKIMNKVCPLCRKPINFREILDIDKNARICKNAESIDHIYSPFIKGGECRFCFGRPIEFFLSNKLK